jgi:hypothetical protein
LIERLAARNGKFADLGPYAAMAEATGAAMAGRER